MIRRDDVVSRSTVHDQRIIAAAAKELNATGWNIDGPQTNSVQ